MKEVRNPLQMWIPDYHQEYKWPSIILTAFFSRLVIFWFLNWVLLCKVIHIFRIVITQRTIEKDFVVQSLGPGCRGDAVHQQREPTATKSCYPYCFPNYSNVSMEAAQSLPCVFNPANASMMSMQQPCAIPMQQQCPGPVQPQCATTTTMLPYQQQPIECPRYGKDLNRQRVSNISTCKSRESFFKKLYCM